MSIKPPSNKEQVKTIKNLEETTSFERGGSAYLISAKWLNSWKENVGYSSKGSSDTKEKILEIDNSCICNEERKFNQNLVEKTDYEILTKEVWEQLLTWYGGGPKVTVPLVINRDKELVALVKSFDVFIIYKKKKVEKHLNDYVKIKDLKKELGLQKKKNLKMVLLRNDKVECEMDESKYIGDYSINEQCSIEFVPKENKTTKLTKIFDNLKSSIKKNENTISYVGKTGLKNLGNTCFFNSAIQCLLHSRVLMEYILNNEKWKSELNVKNPNGSKGKLVTEFANLAKYVWVDGVKVLSPSDLKHIVGKISHVFSGWGQQDSLELLLTVLNGIHEDLNRAKETPSNKEITGNGKDDIAVSNFAWEKFKESNDSIIVDLFHGQLKSSIQCPECGKCEVNFDPFMSLQLPINSVRSQISITIIFIPFDFEKPYQRFTFNFKKSLDKNSINAMISAKIQRNVDCAFGIQNLDGDFSWGFSLTNKTHKILAFEIPDRKMKYIKCLLKMEMKMNKTDKNTSERDLSFPFLIEITPEQKKKDIQEVIENKISFLWNQPSEEESESYNETAQKCKKDNEEEEEEEEEEESTETEREDNKEKENIKKKTDKDNLKELCKEFKELIGKSNKFKKNKSDIIITYPSFKKIDYEKKYEFILNDSIILFINPDSDLNYNVISPIFNFVNQPNQNPPYSITQDKLTIESCFNSFSEEEVLDEDNKWYCSNCKKNVCAKKKIEIWKVPDILIIQLKRFVGTSSGRLRKQDAKVDFPDSLDIKEFVKNPTIDTELKYNLYAVSNHIGTLNSGHYVACCKVQDPYKEPNATADWYLFNDSKVSEISDDYPHSSSAYVLFYEKIH